MSGDTPTTSTTPTAPSRFIVAANWKMNGRLAGVAAYAQGLVHSSAVHGARCCLMVAPPTVLLHPMHQALQAAMARAVASDPGSRPVSDPVSSLLSPSQDNPDFPRILATSYAVGVMAQNCHDQDDGAFTGDVSAAMLRDIGVGSVIVGHSERRRAAHESDALIYQKIRTAQARGLNVILCVGELEKERAAGQTLGLISSQLDAGLGGFRGQIDWRRLAISYEPVWAIGTGQTPSVELVSDVVDHIRGYLMVLDQTHAEHVPVLYGGSVTETNVHQWKSACNGVLVGGASLLIERFQKIIAAAAVAA